MKVAHIVCSYPPLRGGIGNSAYHFARILVNRGYDVTVFTPKYKTIKSLNSAGEFEQGEKQIKVEWLRPLFSYGYAAIMPQLLWRLRGFDVIHLHYPFYGASLIVLLRKLLMPRKTTLIIHYHMDTVETGLKGFIFKFHRYFILPLLVRSARLITCASMDYVKHSYLASYYKHHQNKFRQTLFGVNIEKFKPRVVGDTSGKNILFVGGLDRGHYFKGLPNLLKAFSLLSQELSNIHLDIIGEGNLRKKYERLAAKLNIADKVFFAGNIDNNILSDYYNRCTVAVLPSIDKSEAFGLVLLEAMACGKPVIASNLPGVRSVFKNGREGLAIQPSDVADLAAKLKVILTDDALAKKMGAAARETVEKKYTWDEVGNRLDLIYHHAAYVPKL